MEQAQQILLELKKRSSKIFKSEEAQMLSTLISMGITSEQLGNMVEKKGGEEEDGDATV